MKYIIILIYLLSFHCYSDELYKSFSNNCVYDDITDNGFIPVHAIRFKASDIDLGVDIGQSIAEMSFTDASLSTSILHCKDKVDLKLIINARHYKDDIFKTGIPGIGFKLSVNKIPFNLAGDEFNVTPKYANVCNYQTRKEGYKYIYCTDSWPRLYIQLIKIGEIDLASMNDTFIIHNFIVYSLDNKKFTYNHLIIEKPQNKVCELNIDQSNIELAPVEKNSLSDSIPTNETHFSVHVICNQDTLVSLKLDAPAIYKSRDTNLLTLLNNGTPSGVGLFIKYKDKNYYLGNAIYNSAHSSPSTKYTFPFSVGYVKMSENILPGKVTSQINVNLEYK
ncbi:fimbrial protein [Proteus mirabilis]|uniref:fimbrial protein n=1 Tax=Proteus mirabilis TaxID=584 RepID=UPI0022E30ADA|nr:fimbrial protein [Proteus mirabilis]